MKTPSWITKRGPRYSRLRTAVLLFSLSWICVWYSINTAQEKYADDFDKDIYDIWSEQIDNFPVHPKDRYAFHEMGFRTHIFGQALERSDTEQAAKLGSSIWGHTWPNLRNTSALRRGQLRSPGQKTSFVRHDQHGKRGSILLGREMDASDPSTSRRSRGIVTIAERHNLRATVELVTTLRYSLKDDTPIEIFYHGSNDLPELIESAFSLMPGIRTFNLATRDDFGEAGFDALNLSNMTQKRSTTLQALALMFSQFDEIIYAAPGVIFFRKPIVMLEERGYLSTGTLFFHGSTLAQKADSTRLLNFLRQQFDQGQPTADLARSPYYNYGIDSQQDPQVLVVDKSRPKVFASLMFNLWLHSPPVREVIWLAHFPECLTESVWLAFEMSKTPYYFVEAYPGAVGTYEGSVEDLPWEPKICPAHALHFIGRSSYASRRGVPMWADGGLRVFPHHQDALEVDAWSARGRWIQTNLGLCLEGADAQSPEKFALADLYSRFQLLDKTFTEIFRPIFEFHEVPFL